MNIPLRSLILIVTGGPVPPTPGDYSPSFDFSDARNSMYFVMGWP